MDITISVPSDLDDRVAVAFGRSLGLDHDATEDEIAAALKQYVVNTVQTTERDAQPPPAPVDLG